MTKKQDVFAKVTAILSNGDSTQDHECVVPKKHRTGKMAALLERLVDKYESLEDRLYKDPDTGLPNYQAFTKDLLDLVLQRKETRKEAEKINQPFAQHDTIIFLDINYFKEFNSKFGMQTTDSLIKAIAGGLQSHMRMHHPSDRTPDILARAKKGGDEFLILLRGCSREDANKWVKGMFEEIKKKTFIIPHKHCAVSNISLAYGYYELDSRLRKDEGEDYDLPHAAIDKAETLMRARKTKMKNDGRATPPTIVKDKALVHDLLARAKDDPTLIEVEDPSRRKLG